MEPNINLKTGKQKNSISTILIFIFRNLICYNEESLEFCSRPKMQLVEVMACDEDHFILSAPGIASLRVKIPDIQDNGKKGNIL